VAASIINDHLHDFHNMPPGILAPPGIYVATHWNPAHTGPHELRIAAPMVLPECNICRRVRFSRKCDITAPIEEYEFFSGAARRQSLICLQKEPKSGSKYQVKKSFLREIRYVKDQFQLR
jgi:hypothetical protein